jgi:N-acetylmuramoyl-L-alanine amidase CwlA
MATPQEMAQAVMKYAQNNYNVGSWHTVVDRYDIARLVDEVGWAPTFHAAIAHMAWVCDELHSHRGCKH